MKCPHCNQSISMFSREMNRFRRHRRCSHCDGPVRMFVSVRIAALILAPAVVLILLLEGVFISLGWPDSLASGLVMGLLMVFAIRLKAA